MNICIPKERRDSEYRVGLTPAGVQLLTEQGHTLYVEHEAGVGSGFGDHHYQEAGGTIVYSGEEVYGRADLVIKVDPPLQKEYDWMREGQTLMGFMHLTAGRPSKVRTLLEKRITAIGYEIIQKGDGRLPVLVPISQLAGRMVPQIAATLAQNNYGGKGFSLGGVPGVPPADVVILGGGIVGRNAAQTFLGLGANVYLLDNSLDVLHTIDQQFNGQVKTLVSYPFNIEKVCSYADILIGAILVPGAPTPVIVTREMVQSIDQGGCFETSRPTSHSNPTYIEEDVIHYCVHNMTGVLGRTATHALNNAAWPFIKQVAKMGVESAIQENGALQRGVYTHSGDIINEVLNQALEGR